MSQFHNVKALSPISDDAIHSLLITLEVVSFVQLAKLPQIKVLKVAEHGGWERITGANGSSEKVPFRCSKPVLLPLIQPLHITSA